MGISAEQCGGGGARGLGPPPPATFPPFFHEIFGRANFYLFRALKGPEKPLGEKIDVDKTTPGIVARPRR